ncbi:MAG TPA: hypothetical protein VF181_04730 [Balneolaceae bacterium]
MKTLILFILMSTAIASASMAQKTDREIYPKQVSIEHNEAVKSFSGDFVTAFLSNFSLADLQQASKSSLFSSINMIGNENVAFLIQEGLNNAGMINILGRKNEAKLSQRGQNLFSILNLFGNYNNFEMVQQGTGLQSYLNLGGSGLNFEAFQTNSGMTLIQRGPGAIPLTIHQTGQAIPIIIRNY